MAIDIESIEKIIVNKLKELEKYLSKVKPKKTPLPITISIWNASCEKIIKLCRLFFLFCWFFFTIV